MTAHDVGLLMLDLALILVLARIGGWLAQKVGQPPVVGEIIAGIALGPTIIGPHLSTVLVPTDIRIPLSALANVGLVLFMFIVGYELDLLLMRGKERIAVSVSVASILLPCALGITLAYWLADRHNVTGDDRLPFVLFMGAAMSITAFPVLARILTDRGMHRTRLGGLALASAAVDDVLAWSLLAVVVTVAGASADTQWHVLLTLPYVALMFFVVRPLLRRLLPLHAKAGRLTPALLAVVLIGLLLSAYAAEWLGVHVIFGAFLFGTVMPREGGEALRQDILERLEQVSVLLLLPVFFVTAGIKVDLRNLGTDGLVELGLILLVAISGKFIGAYLGAKLQKVQSRQAFALATLMNTRGLTELVILAVGLQLGILNQDLYSLMVVMALVTTAMAGPLLSAYYPKRRIERDIAEAERATLGESPATRVLVVVDDPATQGDDVELAGALVGSRRPAEVVLSRLLPYRSPQLEVGTGLSGELLEMTRSLEELETLAARVRRDDVPAPVLSRFSDDVERELGVQIETSEPDVVVVRAGAHALADRVAGELVTVGTLPVAPSSVAVRWGTDADATAALRVGALLAVSRGLPLIVDDGERSGRRAVAAAADLARHGLVASADPAPADALVVTGGTEVSAGTHVAVRAARDTDAMPVADWVADLPNPTDRTPVLA
ncbi:cation:proton antiporter [Cryptosporangium aurantiacum]|uniref:Kef-type K+ transport system, membrane component KefB n=1 Tax=Cryptosporangium aurantiacum TaxID=134849 RepID=A0A1M7RJV2_9ACTN|nr:cation:proton antiporter [Cryptosporangium aurantiacum]SHN46348.1 Kef-type K+ transport system, membrane component KefB [Cryptosporangium aurantiacum]